MTPNIVIADIETSPMEVASFSLYPESIGHQNILKDWFIICAAWKSHGEKKVHAAKITKAGEDKAVVKQLRDALADADIIVGQNIAKFDIKKLNARLIYHKLPPLPLVPVVDTLKESKKIASFSSHRLDYLGQHLIGEGKIDTTPGLWLKAMKGDKKAIAEMVRYNKVDVVRTEQLYDRIRPYIKSHPAMGVMMGVNAASCNCCGSVRLKKNGIRVSAAGRKRQEMQCLDCGHYQSMPITKL